MVSAGGEAAEGPRPVESRTRSTGSAMLRESVRRPVRRSCSILAAIRPISCRGWVTRVRWGRTVSAPAEES